MHHFYFTGLRHLPGYITKPTVRSVPDATLPHLKWTCCIWLYVLCDLHDHITFYCVECGLVQSFQINMLSSKLTRYQLLYVRCPANKIWKTELTCTEKKGPTMCTVVSSEVVEPCWGSLITEPVCRWRSRTFCPPFPMMRPTWIPIQAMKEIIQQRTWRQTSIRLYRHHNNHTSKSQCHI